MNDIVNYFEHYFKEFEKDTNPIAGQIFGLLIQKSEETALSEIAEELKLSKAAISIQIRALNKLGYCVKMPRRSDRKDYYKVNDYFIEQIAQNFLRRNEVFVADVFRIISKHKSLKTDVKKRLVNFSKFLKTVNEFLKKM